MGGVVDGEVEAGVGCVGGVGSSSEGLSVLGQEARWGAHYWRMFKSSFFVDNSAVS